MEKMIENYIMKEYIEGKTLDSISSIYGISRNKITSILKQNNINIRNRGKKKGQLTFGIDIQNEICKKYIKGMTTTLLSKQYKCSKTKILYVLRNNDVRMRSRSEQKRKYKINENVFKDINEKSLYWLGFIAADGNLYISPKGVKVVQFGLHKKDENHLNKLKEFLQTDKPIYYYNSKRKYKGDYVITPEVKFVINSLIIFSDIYKYGIKPRKTFNLKINSNLIKAPFFRGFFDGDGSICFNKQRNYRKKSLVICLSGIRQTLETFRSFVKKEINVDLSISSNKTIYRARAYGGKALDVLDLLYNDANIYLDRKMEMYQCWKNQKKH